MNELTPGLPLYVVHHLMPDWHRTLIVAEDLYLTSGSPAFNIGNFKLCYRRMTTQVLKQCLLHVVSPAVIFRFFIQSFSLVGRPP